MGGVGELGPNMRQMEKTYAPDGGKGSPRKNRRLEKESSWFSRADVAGELIPTAPCLHQDKLRQIAMGQENNGTRTEGVLCFDDAPTPKRLPGEKEKRPHTL